MNTIAGRAVPFVCAFLSAFALTYVLTPLVRRMNKHLGMIDKPDKRRVNKVPVPRGGGLALMAGTLLTYSILELTTGNATFGFGKCGDYSYFKVAALAFGISMLGYADDKFGLRPKLKLAGQLVIASLVWLWVGIGFRETWPAIPPVLDFAITVFWIAGAVNAFNLIDGLDGLASGIALIATLGMAGTLFMMGVPWQSLFHLAFAGGLVAFLRYNYNPASIFLGDCGSMFIGFMLSVLPLSTQTPRSFLVSVGVPLLAMGVPIFDTALAILRRLIRRIANSSKKTKSHSGEVMTADVDHVHHRILRATGLNQRKAVMILYSFSVFLVATGLVGVSMKSHAAGFWLVAVTIASIVIFRDMARVELFEAGMLLNTAAHNQDTHLRKRIARLSVPIHLFLDIVALVSIFFFCTWALQIRTGRLVLRIALPLRVVCVFAAMALFGAYRTVWPRAMVSNYVRLALACILGTVLGTVAIYYSPAHHYQLKAMTLAYAPLSFMAIASIRIVRNATRDFIYALDCSRIMSNADTKRVLVYGCGLRYRAFRRELVRSVSANDRMIVGLLDDDILLRGRYIGGLRVLGTINQARELVAKNHVNAVVIACDVTDEWLKVVKEILKPTGVEITRFRFSEERV